MPRDFNVRFDNVEIIGGSDNLLENANVTKVSMVGDNKLSSLGATFKNCKDLDIIEGIINLNGIDVINEILNDTQYVKNIRLENVNNPNISANLSFPYIENISFDKSYDKTAIQNVLGGCVWSIKDINYYGEVGNSVVNETVGVNNDVNISILNSLEKTCREFEIHGNTFENLVNGKDERELFDGIEINMDNTKNLFPMRVSNDIRIDKIEGDSLFNLVDGERVESLDNSTNRVIINSDFSFNDEKDRKYNINEIIGNTWQDDTDSKNLFDGIVELGGLTNGNIIESTNCRTVNFISIKESTKYIPSNIGVSGWIHYYDNKKTFIQREAMYDNTVFDTPKGISFMKVAFDSSSISKTPQIEEGTASTSYEPYHKADLSDIRHLGELYVDEQGNPILDDLGREQYRYDITSHTKNLLDGKNLEVGNLNYMGKEEGGGLNRRTSFIKVISNCYYRISGDKIDSSKDFGGNFMCFYNKDKEFISYGQFTDLALTRRMISPINAKYIRLSWNDFSNVKTVQLEEGEISTSYAEYKSSTKSILLPYQLKKVGDIADRLYWDNMKGKYCIEENIVKYIIDGDLIIGETYSDDKYPNVIGVAIINPNVLKQRCHLMSNIFQYNGTSPIDAGRLVSNDEKIYVRDYIFVSIKKEKLETLDRNGFKKYFTDNNLIIYGESTSPQIIYTDIKSPIKISSYKDKTYLSFNNNINPSRMDIRSGNKAFYDINLKPNTLYTIQLDLFLENDLSPSQLSVNLGGKILTENITEDSFNKLVKITTSNTLANNNLTIVGEGLICQNVMLFETDLKVAVGKYVNGEQHVGEEIIDYFDGKEIEINNPQYKYKLENIIGNTWQDYNVPNSLKSVGELYTDNSGLPILDSEGKKQYKVDIVARDKGLTTNIKKTILLPKQLHYIKTLYNGDINNANNTIICDELYWDNDFNKYMIKENVKEYITQNINYNGETNIIINLPSDMKSEINANSDCGFVMDGVRVKGWNSTSKNTDLAIRRNGGNNYICLATIGIFTNLEVSQKLSNKKILYQTINPKIIETNITEKLTFNDADYFTPYTKFELDNLKSDIKLSNKYYLIDLKTSTYDMEGRDIKW